MDRIPSTDLLDIGSDDAAYQQFVSYERGSATVICDRKNPDAWIRSELAVNVEQ